jgi:hypothetical protein
LHGDAAARAQPCYATVLARKIEGAVMELMAGLIEQAQELHATRVALARNVGRLVRDQATDDAARKIGAYQKQVTESRQLLAQASVRFFKGEVTKLAYDATAEHLTASIETAEQGMAELRGVAKRSEVLPVEVILAGVMNWPAVFRAAATGSAADPGALRAMLGRLVVLVQPVRVGYGRYASPFMDLTATGSALLDLACEAIAASNAVAVEQLGTAICRTATPLEALAHGTGHTDDHTVLSSS